MQVTMKDRVAVVTGGSNGRGRAGARHVADTGAQGAILARGTLGVPGAKRLSVTGTDQADRPPFVPLLHLLGPGIDR